MKYEFYDSKGDYHMVKYADDFVIFAQSKKPLTKYLKSLSLI